MSFAMSTTVKKLHHTRLMFKFNENLCRELKRILKALSSPWINMWRSIGHLVDHTPSGLGCSDSYLHAASGFSFNM